jgi:hypothetical protein
VGRSFGISSPNLFTEPTCSRDFFSSDLRVVPSSGHEKLESLDQGWIDSGVIRGEVCADAVGMRLNYLQIHGSELIGAARHNIPGPEERFRLRRYAPKKSTTFVPSVTSKSVSLAIENPEFVGKAVSVEKQHCLRLPTMRTR